MNKENFLKGIIGGFIGSLVGVVAILFFYKLGYVAAAAGLLMAVSTIGLYKKFAGGISKKGFIACVIIMLVMTFVGNNLAFSITLVDELKTFGINSDVTYVFLNLFSLMSEGAIVISSYVYNLVLIMFFNILGAFGVIKGQFKNLNSSDNINNNTVNYRNENIVSNNQINTNNLNSQNNMSSNYNNMNNINTNYANNNPLFNQNQMNNNINQSNGINNQINNNIAQGDNVIGNFGVNSNDIKDNNMI